MKKIGMVVAIEREIRAVLEEFGRPVEEKKFGPITVHTYERAGALLYVAHSGIGEIAAAAATQLLISVYNVEMILNCGVVGGLTADMGTKKTTVVKAVVHYDYDSSPIDPVVPGQYIELPDVYIPTDATLVEKALKFFPELTAVICASADKFVAEADAKTALHDRYGAEVCDMESAGISLTCFRNNVPVMMLKTVADAIDGGADGYEKACLSTAKVCMGIAEKLIGEL